VNCQRRRRSTPAGRVQLQRCRMKHGAPANSGDHELN
jgi:hypothetical protein